MANGLGSNSSTPEDVSPSCRRWVSALWFHAIGGKCWWHSEAKIIDFASLSLAAWPMPGDPRESLVVFLSSISAATLISSCKTSAEFTTLWNEQTACNPVTQAAAQLLGSWEKTCGTNPTVTKRTLCYLTVCGSHLIFSLFKMSRTSQRRSQLVAHWFCWFYYVAHVASTVFWKLKRKKRKPTADKLQENIETLSFWGKRKGRIKSLACKLTANTEILPPLHCNMVILLFQTKRKTK